jgi:hypothetical protein
MSFPVPSSAVEPSSFRQGGGFPRSRVCRLIAAGGVGLVLVSLAAAPAGFGAKQQGVHFRDAGTDLDPDFCGTGQAIEIAFNIRGTEWAPPNHGGEFKIVATGKFTLSNPDTGDVVIQRFAGPIWETVVSGNPDGLHVIESTVKGLPELIKRRHGGVLTRDAGYAVIRTTLDGEEFLGTEVVFAKGPHPDLDSDFELFCEIVPPALGIT